MNHANMERLAKHIERSKRFHMRYYVRTWGLPAFFLEFLPRRLPCGTTCCIGGEAALMSGKRSGHIRDVARKFLGLTAGQAHHLFTGRWTENGVRETDQKRAARAIRALAAADKREPGSVPVGYVL